MGKHFFLKQKIRSLRLSKGAVCKRDDGLSTGIESSVTLNSFQGLYKFWLYVLQIPNQVRDDAFFAKMNPFPELVEGSLFAKKYGPSRASGTVL